MKPHEMVDSIANRHDLVRFIESLVKDLRTRPEEWENISLVQYLEALASWLDDSNGYYRNTGQGIPSDPSWKPVADMLIAAKMYE